MKFLQKISNGISDLSQQSSKSIVFISISKIIKSRPVVKSILLSFSLAHRVEEIRTDKIGNKKSENSRQVLDQVF